MPKKSTKLFKWKTVKLPKGWKSTAVQQLPKSGKVRIRLVKRCPVKRKSQPSLPGVRILNTGFWDNFDKEILRKKKR